jgi:hypothetical protein
VSLDQLPGDVKKTKSDPLLSLDVSGPKEALEKIGLLFAQNPLAAIAYGNFHLTVTGVRRSSFAPPATAGTLVFGQFSPDPGGRRQRRRAVTIITEVTENRELQQEQEQEIFMQMVSHTSQQFHGTKPQSRNYQEKLYQIRVNDFAPGLAFLRSGGWHYRHLS